MRFLALLLVSSAAFGGTWTAHPIVPFGPLAACHACTAIPGELTISWAAPVDESTGEPFVIDHYVLVYELLNTYDVDFIEAIPASATSYTLTGLTSAAQYAVWLEARGTDGYTHAVTPWMSLTAP